MFSHGEEVLVLIDGVLVKGEVIAIAKNDEGKFAYEIKAPNNALGAPTRHFKGCDVFQLEPTPEERREESNKLTEKWWA
jgi:hypothetical protein